MSKQLTPIDQMIARLGKQKANKKAKKTGKTNVTETPKKHTYHRAYKHNVDWTPHYPQLITLRLSGFSNSEISCLYSAKLGIDVRHDDIRHAVSRAHKALA